MSEQEFIGTKRLAVSTGDYGPCKFYGLGQCKFGATCVYTHVKTTSTSRVDSLCQFFVKGFCAEGNNCRFLHLNPKTSMTIQTALPEVSETVVCK